MKGLLPEYLTARQIAESVFGGCRSARWVRQNVCPAKARRFGHRTVLWRRDDVLQWLVTFPAVREDAIGDAAGRVS